MNIFRLILFIITVEAITEIAINSELWETPREWLKKRGWFFKSLLSCGWCFSMWVAWGLYGFLYWTEAWWILFPFVAHRASNYLHVAYESMRRTQWQKIEDQGDSAYPNKDWHRGKEE
jgi:hypothetical protein